MGTAGMFGISDIEHLTAYNEHCKVSLKIWKNCPKMLQITVYIFLSSDADPGFGILCIFEHWIRERFFSGSRVSVT
jgi:hypothetical protein